MQGVISGYTPAARYNKKGYMKGGAAHSVVIMAEAAYNIGAYCLLIASGILAELARVPVQ